MTLTGALALASAGNALALSGIPAQIGAATDSPVSVAVDSSGTAYVAWLVGSAGPADGPSQVDVCRMVPGATSCAPTTLTTSGNSSIDQAMLTINGTTVVLVAQDFGGGTDTQAFGVDEWTAPDGSTSFTAIDSGNSVSPGNDYVPDNIFALPGSTNSIGYGFGSVGNNIVSVSDITPFTSPPTCYQDQSTSCSTPVAKLNQATPGYDTQDDRQEFASEGGSDPGVLGVFDADVPSSCPADGSDGSPGDSFIYGSGNQSSTNSFGISPGTTHSAWRTDIVSLDCNGEYPSVAGGPGGFGVLEADEANKSMVYLPFDAATGAFDRGAFPITQGEATINQTSVSQDGGGGIYATWVDGNEVYPGAVRLAYSSNGGATWTGPATLNDLSYPLLDPSSAVGSDGQGWMVWTQSLGNGEYGVDAQQFDSADAVPTATAVATSQTAGSQHGASLTVPAGTTGETDQAVISGTNGANAGGSVTYNLYSSPTCSASSLVFGGGSQSVSGGVAGPSNAVDSALAAGTYYWQASYSGDLWNAPSASACGSEVLTISPAAAGSPPGTSAGATATSTGTTVTITVSCAGPCTVTLTITYTGTEAQISRKKQKLHTVTLGSTKVRFFKKGSKKVTIHLTRAGVKLLRAHHQRLTVSLKLAETFNGHTFSHTRKLKITPAPKKKGKKH